MGSAALYHLATRGVRALGLDRYRPPHTLGSSHGRSRIIREAYWEQPIYVPLVRRAYTLWDQLAERSGQPVYRRTGGLMLGPEDGPVVSGSRESARVHGISHEILDAAGVRRRFPGFTPPDHFVALWEERAGILIPEVANLVHLNLAEQYGAVIRTSVPVQSWQSGGGGVRVTTVDGVFEAGSLILAVGAWIPTLFGHATSLFTIERQLFHWFKPTMDASGWPVALWEHRRGGLFATLPEAPARVKAGIHHDGERVDPETANRVSTPAEAQDIRRLLAEYQPAMNGSLIETAVCLYTNTPDGHFLIDRHPDHANVLVVSPCSGHGFKFSSAIGEVVADLVTTGRSEFDLTPFQFSRFG